MEIKRSCYLVYYRRNRTVNEIKRLKEVDIYYNSKRLRYLTIYFDTKDEKNILNKIRRIKGVLKVEKSQLDQLDGSLLL